MILTGQGGHQLKRVYTTASLWEAREIVTLLEQQRIPAMLLNEHVAGTPGVLPFNPGMTVDAEVWVLDDGLADRCARLIVEFQAAASPSVAGGDVAWQCAACREDNPAGFDLCWACGQSR
jgi:Putative prokaryotic signal transducing protein